MTETAKLYHWKSGDGLLILEVASSDGHNFKFYFEKGLTDSSWHLSNTGHHIESAILPVEFINQLREQLKEA